MIKRQNPRRPVLTGEIQLVSIVGSLLVTDVNSWPRTQSSAGTGAMEERSRIRFRGYCD